MICHNTPELGWKMRNQAQNETEFGMKRLLLTFLIAGTALAGMAGCAQIKTSVPQPVVTVTGSSFDRVGWVTLYAGEPCAPQIMFDFQSARSTVSLAAPMRQTRILTDAANKKRRVHILGKWRRGGQSNCSYVEVTSAELTG
jgi:hypothetical protein